MLLSHSCRSWSKRSTSSVLSRLHLFSPCCSFQRRSSDVLWLSASRRRCSSRSCVIPHSGSPAGSPSPPCASPRTFPCASSSTWSKKQRNSEVRWRESFSSYMTYCKEKTRVSSHSVKMFAAEFHKHLYLIYQKAEIQSYCVDMLPKVSSYYCYHYFW